jgi:hypothetical protein
MMENQGISHQIDVSNRIELRRPSTHDCKVVEISSNWKSKAPGYGAVRHKDSHHQIFLDETQDKFPKTIQVIPKNQITLSEKYSKLETRAQNLILSETKGRYVNPIISNTRHYNYVE